MNSEDYKTSYEDLIDVHITPSTLKSHHEGTRHNKRASSALTKKNGHTANDEYRSYKRTQLRFVCDHTHRDGALYKWRQHASSHPSLSRLIPCSPTNLEGDAGIYLPPQLLLPCLPVQCIPTGDIYRVLHNFLPEHFPKQDRTVRVNYDRIVKLKCERFRFSRLTLLFRRNDEANYNKKEKSFDLC